MTPAQAIARIRSLQKAREDIRKALQKQPEAESRSSESLLDFVARSPGLESPRHLAPIAKVLETALDKPIRAVFSTPPQHGKTVLLSHALVRLLQRYPKRRNAYVTYEARRAEEVSLDIQRIATDAGLRWDGSRKIWRTAQGGGLFATGVGGPLTGYPVDGLMLVDDAIKNRVEAESSVIRNRIHNWFTSVALTRCHPIASVVIVATRWHSDDLSGRCIKAGWESVNLKAVQNGKALWPEQRPIEWLEEQRRQIGEYDWSSLYMGEPRNRGASVFHDVVLCDELPTQARYAIGIDFAYTAKTHSDYSVAVVLAELDGTYYVVDVRRQQVTAPEFAETLRDLMDLYPGSKRCAFIAGPERGVVDMLNATHKLGIQPLPATTDKFVRAQPVAAQWNNGNLLVPRHAEWTESFVDEIVSFTGVSDAHDDQVDALAGAYAALQRRGTCLDSDTSQYDFG